MAYVDNGRSGILQGRPGLDAGDVNVEDQDVEQHREQGENCAGPQRGPHPPWLARNFLVIHSVSVPIWK